MQTSKFRRIHMLWLVALLASACKLKTQSLSEVKVDAGGSRILDATISDGVVLIRKTEAEANFDEIIRGQLSYSLARLIPIEASASISRALISIASKNEYAGDKNFLEVRYETKLVLLYPDTMPLYASTRFVAPAILNERDEHNTYLRYNEAFFTAFREKCNSEDGKNIPPYKFWHYMSLAPADCPLNSLLDPQTPDTSVLRTVDGVTVASLIARFSPSTEATSNKRPEYDEIWKDGRLVINSVHTTDSAIKKDDVGVKARIAAFRGMLTTFDSGQIAGTKLKSMNIAMPKSEDEWANISITEPELDATFSTPKGDLEIHLYLMNDFPSLKEQQEALKPAQKPDETPGDEGQDDNTAPDQSSVSGKSFDDYKTFKAHFDAADADVVAYFGHSQLGHSIRDFLQSLEAKSGKYRIVWLQACNTFMYAEPILEAYNAKANPGTSYCKYNDIVANSTYGYFNVMEQQYLALARGLVGATSSYREILQSFDLASRPVVFCEEDNGEDFPKKP